MSADSVEIPVVLYEWTMNHMFNGLACFNEIQRLRSEIECLEAMGGKIPKSIHPITAIDDPSTGRDWAEVLQYLWRLRP